jgi:hypothetical protein
VSSTESVKTKPKADFIAEWRALRLKTLMEVYLIGMPFWVFKNKQGEIRVDDATENLKSLS